METPSHLDLFLRQQETEGVVQSQGHFTMAKERALSKIAEFQLPFHGAWVVKLIQCAATSGSAPIRVDLVARESRFFFQADWLSLEEVEREFFNPATDTDCALGHLLSALWAVGLREKWAFQIGTKGEDTTLIWDGQKLNRVQAQRHHDCTLVSVTQRSKESGALSWVKSLAKAGSLNAEILTTLTRWCYTSPVPLTVDGRRIDTLYNCPKHGVGLSSFPLSIGFGSGALPDVSIPLGTYQDVPAAQDPRGPSFVAVKTPTDYVGLRAANDKSRGQLRPVAKAPVPFLLTTHFKWVKDGNTQSWEPSSETSTIHWVRDGVVVDEEKFTSFSSRCSVGVFLSAEGLPSDLTSFHLAECPEREERVEKAKRIVSETLAKLGAHSDPLDEAIHSGQKRERICAGAFFLLGLAVVWASPFHGVGMMVGGTLVAKNAGATEKKRVAEIKTAIESFRTRLAKQTQV